MWVNETIIGSRVPLFLNLEVSNMKHTSKKKNMHKQKQKK